MRTKDLHNEFEQFLLRLFQHYDLIAEQARGTRAYDILLKVRGKEVLVEAKLYRYTSPNRTLLLNAVAQLSKAKEDLKASNTVIVTTDALSAEELLEIERSTIVYDLPALIFLTRHMPELWETLSSILLELNEEFDLEKLPMKREVTLDLNALVEERAAYFPRRVVTTGADLCRAIKQVSPGKDKILVDGIEKSAAAVFELRVFEALKYLFTDHLRNWQPQKRSDTGLSRYDLVAKIVSRDPFWNSLISDFRTRYILFECKNFTTALAQIQIFTTERYLYPPAMRSAAIIISRYGATKSALAAANGALREAGKLIVNVSVAELCLMLHAKDRGDDPTLMLAAKVDDMLIRIER